MSTVVEVECRELARAVSNVGRFTSPNDNRPALSQVHVRLRDGVLTLSATDSFALIRHTLTASGVAMEDFSCVVADTALAPVGAAAAEMRWAPIAPPRFATWSRRGH
jgi:DNA polymerase III sliding clamp (beta) subunit (PCNA family)